MKCTVVLLVVTVLVGFARAAPQRGIDFLPGADEEFPAEVKPVLPEVEEEDQDEQQQQQQQEVLPLDEEQQRDQSVTEEQATVEPVEDEQQTEDPPEDVTELAEDEQEDEEQFKQDPEQQEILDPVTDQPEDTASNTTNANETDSSRAVANVTTPSPPEEATSPKDDATTTDSGVQLTTDPIVVAEPSSTESTDDDGSQFAEDVNSLAEDSANRVGYGLEENEEQTPVEPLPAAPRPRPNPARPRRPPVASTDRPAFGAPPRVSSASDEYESKSLESNEDDDQVQLKVNPNEVQPTSPRGEEQFRTSLPSWFSGTPRFTGYDHWQPSLSQRPSSWQAPARDDQPRHYQPNGFDTAFHGHGFHRSSWH